MPEKTLNEDLEIKEGSDNKSPSALHAEKSNKEARRREYLEMSPSPKELLLKKRKLQFQVLDDYQRHQRKQKHKQRFDNLNVEEQNAQRLSEKKRFDNLNVEEQNAQRLSEKKRFVNLPKTKKMIQRLKEATNKPRSLKLRKKNMAYQDLSNDDKNNKIEISRKKNIIKSQNLTLSQRNHINVARKLNKYIDSDQAKELNLTSNDMKAIRGENKLIDLDLRYVTEDDFKNIQMLDALNNEGEKDDKLVYLVKLSLRTNNYILSCLKKTDKIKKNNSDEKMIFDLVNSVSNFSFRNTEKYNEISKDIVSPINSPLTAPKNDIIIDKKINENSEDNYDLVKGGIVNLNFMTTKEIKYLHFAKLLRKFLKEYPNRGISLTSNDQDAIDGKESLHRLDLRFVPKDDFFSIKDLERENIKKNIDSVLITFVTEILRLNNYVIGFLKGIGKVQLITELETILFESFQEIRDFSFRKISHFDEPTKIYHPFRDSGIRNVVMPRSLTTTTTITIINSNQKTDSPVYVNLLSNEYDNNIHENFIGENQTITSSYKHFPLTLLADNKIKISATSSLLNLLPKNFDSVLENPRNIVPENKDEKKVKSRLRLKRPKKKTKKQKYIMNRAEKLFTYDNNLKNWNIEPDVFNDLEVEIITQVTSGIIEDYPENFKKKFPHFFDYTRGSRFFLDNNQTLKNKIAQTMSTNLRISFTHVCASCDHTCWPYSSYKVFVNELPPICKKIFKIPLEHLPNATLNYYNISNKIWDRRFKRTYAKLMLAPKCLDHADDLLHVRQYFYFCKECAYSLGAQLKKTRGQKILLPKFSIVNQHFMGKIKISKPLGTLTFITQQMFSRIHQIGKVVNLYSEHIKKFGLKHTFGIEPTKLFKTCPLRPVDIKLKVILTGAYTSEERIAKLKPYKLDKTLVREIYKELVNHEFPHYVNMQGICEENMSLYPDEIGEIAPAILVEEKINKRVVKKIKRSARIQNKTYGVNLVNDDDNNIDKRVISTCTIEHDPENFEDSRIVLKLKKHINDLHPNEPPVYVLKSSTNIKHPNDTSQLTIGFDWLFPNDRGHFNEMGRDHRFSVEEYCKHLLYLSHSGFCTPFPIQQLYNFIVRSNMWDKMRLQSKILIDGEKCVEAYAKLPEKDVKLLIEHFDEVQKCRIARKPIPMIPSDLPKQARHFMNNVKCVLGVIPHSNASAVQNRNCYTSMITDLGQPRLWISANPNSVENPIIIHRITGEIYKFKDLLFVQKSNLMAGNPGSSAIFHKEFQDNIIRYWLGLDPVTLRPTVLGGILPRGKAMAMAHEQDGAQSMHFHICLWGFPRGSLKSLFNRFRKCPEHVVEKGYESGIWKYGFWHDNGKTDYFNLKDHIKINTDLDSTVVPHLINLIPKKDDSAFSKAMHAINLKNTKQIVENFNDNKIDVDFSNSDSDFDSPVHRFTNLNDSDVKLGSSKKKIPPPNLKKIVKKDFERSNSPEIIIPKTKNNNQFSNYDLFVSPPEQHSPDVINPPLSNNNQSTSIVRVIPKIILGRKKISLPQTKCFMIPDFLAKNINTEKHCSNCVNRFKDLGNDFIRMTKNNLISELPFSKDIQKIALQCTKCNSEKNLILVTKNVISNLRKMCRDEEPKYLKCPDCKSTFTSTEKIIEAFDAASMKYNRPKIDLTRTGKKKKFV